MKSSAIIATVVVGLAVWSGVLQCVLCAANPPGGDLDDVTYDTIVPVDKLVFVDTGCPEFVFDGDKGTELILRFCEGELKVTGNMPKDKAAKVFLDYLNLDFKARCAARNKETK